MWELSVKNKTKIRDNHWSYCFLVLLLICYKKCTQNKIIFQRAYCVTCHISPCPTLIYITHSQVKTKTKLLLTVEGASVPLTLLMCTCLHSHSHPNQYDHCSQQAWFPLSSAQPKRDENISQHSKNRGYCYMLATGMQKEQYSGLLAVSWSVCVYYNYLIKN